MDIEKEFGEKDYTFENPYIKLNPYNRTPLGALINFKSGYSENPVRITVKGVDGSRDFMYTINKMGEKGIPVINLYPNTENKVNIKILSKDRTKIIKEKIFW